MQLHRTQGFTLLELLVAVFVLSIVLTIGIPAFSQFADNNRMASSVNDMVATLHAARTEAVKRRGTVSVCPSADWNTANPSCNLGGNFRDGWISFVDVDGDVFVDAGDQVLRTHGPLNNRILLDARDVNDNPVGQYFVSFGGTGFLRAAPAGPSVGSFEYCDHRGDHDNGGGLAAGRFVSLSATGRPQIFRMRADVQNPAMNPMAGC